uniref:Uncharacterized protein n=1 Tax=Glossina palpalis gambiensis TaxID=67801 RepID=A0A1B0BAF8_9MUSC
MVMHMFVQNALLDRQEVVVAVAVAVAVAVIIVFVVTAVFIAVEHYMQAARQACMQVSLKCMIPAHENYNISIQAVMHVSICR